jgi:hypothetical protein
VHAAILTAKQRLPNEEKGAMSWSEDLRPPAVWEHFYQLTMCECVFMSVPVTPAAIVRTIRCGAGAAKSH